MVQIQLHDNVLPIDFGTFQLEFVANDENKEKVKALYQSIKEIDTKDKSDEELSNEMIKALKPGIDNIFTEGTFEKIHAISQQTALLTMSYIVQMCEGINKEYLEQAQQGAIMKYINA